MKFYGLKELKKSDEWKDVVGEARYRPLKSAWSLAHTWQGQAAFPASVAAVLKPLELRPVRVTVEAGEALDAQLAPPVTELMVDTIGADEVPVPVAVEGKCEEKFGAPIKDWVRGDGPHGPATLPARAQRLEFLNEVLATGFGPDSELRVQLLQRTATALLHARMLGASRAVVLVHSFVNPGVEDPNYADWCAFLAALPGAKKGMKGTLIGPIPLGMTDVKTFFAWVEDRPVR